MSTVVVFRTRKTRFSPRSVYPRISVKRDIFVETGPGKGEENEKREKGGKKKILFNVSERGGIAQTECKSGKIRIAKQPKAILVAPENEKLATFFPVEQIGKSNAGIPINSTEFHPVSLLFARISRGYSKNRF